MKKTKDNTEIFKSSENQKKEDLSFCDKEKSEKNYYILNFVEIIGSHSDNNLDKKNNNSNDITKYTAEFIIETYKYYISCGTNLKKSINKYSKKNPIKFIGHGNQNIKDWIYNIIEDNSKVIGCGKNFIYIIIHDDDKKYKEIVKISINQLFLIKNKNKNDYFFCCQDKLCFITELFNKILDKKEENIKYKGKDKILLKSGIKITESLLLFNSNKIVSKGENRLFFYSEQLNEIQLREEYSFIFSPNGMTIIPFNFDTEEGPNKFTPKKEPLKNENTKILLCACKKYLKGQKNGILLLKE